MTTITSQQYIAQQIESYYDSDNYLKIEEIITAISDYKDVLQYIPYKVLQKISERFQNKYNYHKKSDESYIDIIISAIKNNQYIITVSGDIPTIMDGVENAYFKFKFDIKISDKKTNNILLSISVDGNGNHYVCGSSNTEIEEFNIFINHYCKTKKDFNNVVDYLQDNWDIYEAEFGNNTVLESRDFKKVFEELIDPESFKTNYDGDEELVDDSASLEEDDASASETEEEEDDDSASLEDEDASASETEADDASEKKETAFHVGFDIPFNLNETMDRISEALDIAFDSYGGYLSDDEQFEIWFDEHGASSGGIWFKKLDYKFISSIVEPLFEALELNKKHKTYTIEIYNYGDLPDLPSDILVPLICYSTAKEKEKHQYLISFSEINNDIQFLKQNFGYDNLTNIKKEYLKYIFNILKDKFDNREKTTITIEEIEKVYNYDFKYKYTKCNPRWQSHVFIDEHWTLLTVTLEEIKDYFESQN